MVEQCHTDCKDRGGAIFCDGQFLNVDSLDDCAAELSSKVSIDVDVSVDINAKVVSNGASKSTAGCSLGAASPGTGSWAAVAAMLAGAVLIRRRRS